MSDTHKASVITMSFVITGNLIGAGILALPVQTGLAGFWPSVLGSVVMWAMMLTTAMILAAQPALTESETADLPSFFQQELGMVGKWITIVANLIILYGLLTAYLAASGSIIGSLSKSFSPGLASIIFFITATLLTVFGMKVMSRGNTVLMIGMWAAFLILVLKCGANMDFSRLDYKDWGFLPATLPVMVTAFHFHNIIPTICRSLGNDQWAVRKAMIIGTLIGLTMNLLWIFVVAGALPLVSTDGNNVLGAFIKNLPATVPLAKHLHSPLFTVMAALFALLATTTSYMANGMALMSFMRDLCATTFNTSNRVLAAALAFLPPLCVAFIEPAIFLKAVNVVGGVGIDVIFGVLPAVLVLKYAPRRWKWTGIVLGALFLVVLFVELGQELGFLQLKPDVEYWTSQLKR
ncbi:MAG: aromatic amino acid transport family protein [Desulfovibrionaceae bacterium]